MVPIPTSSAAPITNPTTVPASPRHAVDPVAEALVRSTDSVPRTTQNACCTPVASATATAAASAIAARSELRNQTERTDACRRTSVAAVVTEATPGVRASAAAALAGAVPGSAPGDSYQCRRAASIVSSDARWLTISASAATDRATTESACACTACAAAIRASGSPARPDSSLRCSAEAARALSIASKSGSAS